MKAEIMDSLSRIETEENVRILYAVESGSRAWGFASSDSDYDVRFIYVHPLDWYLSIRQRRDVIERPISGLLDINGWDLRKALGLFKKSNPPLLEWLGSPLVYLEQSFLAVRLRELMNVYFSPQSCMHHYLHMARGNYREYLKGEVVRIKKYFYVLRPVLACLWIERRGDMPPTEFARLVDSADLPEDLKSEIDGLLARKMAGEELDDGPRINIINAFLEERLAYYSEFVAGMERTGVDEEKLDKLFREILWDARPYSDGTARGFKTRENTGA